MSTFDVDGFSLKKILVDSKCLLLLDVYLAKLGIKEVVGGTHVKKDADKSWIKTHNISLINGKKWCEYILNFCTNPI